MAISTLIPAGAMNFTENQQACIVFEKLWSQRESGRFCDIVLHVQGQKFLAHRNVLAASSPYFDSVLKTHKIIKEQLTVTCQNLDAFQLLLNYMYTGAIVIDKNNVLELLRLANHFLVLKLKNYCAEYLDRYLDSSNCLSVKDMADKYNLPALQKSVSAFIHSHIAEIVEQNEILELNIHKLESFLKDKQCFIPQHALFSFICKWVEHDVIKREHDLKMLLTFINWESIERQYLDEQLRSNNLLHENPKCMYIILTCLEENKIDVPEFHAIHTSLKSQFGPGGFNFDNDSFFAMSTPIHSLQKCSLEVNVEDMPVTVAPLEKDQSKEKITVLPQSEITNESSNSSSDDGILDVVLDADSINLDDDSQSSAEKEKEKSINIERSVRPKEKSSSPTLVKKSDETQKSVTIIKLTSKSSVASSNPMKSIAKNEKHNSKPFKLSQNASNQRKKLEKLVAKKGYMSESDTDTDDINDENEDNNGSSSATDSSIEEPVNDINKSKWKDGVKCPCCVFVAHNSARLERHVSRIHARDVTYKCKFCDYTCNLNNVYYTHMKSHFEGPPYQCDSCEYNSDTISFFLIHRMKHTGVRPFKCDECDHRCRTKANLEAHIRSHTGEKPYQCEHCDRRFSMKGSLDQHLATHKEDRPYLCDTCGFSTKYQSHLFSHKRIHTGDVFRCHFPNCKYSTPKKSQLGSHHRTHTAVRSHICSICGRAFIEKSHLVRHERIHLNEKPFKCDHCDYCSSRRDKLKEHFRKHHGENATAKGPYRPRKQRRQGYEVSMYSPPNKNTSTESDSHQLLPSQHMELQATTSSLSNNNPVVYNYDTSHPDAIHSHAAVALQQLGAAAHGYQVAFMDQRHHHSQHSHSLSHIGSSTTSAVSNMITEQSRINIPSTSHDGANTVSQSSEFGSYMSFM